jgi:hypothetical protein
MNVKKLAMITLSMSLISCASVAIKDDDIVKRTAHSQGWEKDSFTISNRINEGTHTTFVATTKSGKKYNCSMDGSISFVGSLVTDPICVEVGGAAPSNCNPLLKKAGKCK